MAWKIKATVHATDLSGVQDLLAKKYDTEREAKDAIHKAERQSLVGYKELEAIESKGLSFL